MSEIGDSYGSMTAEWFGSELSDFMYTFDDDPNSDFISRVNHISNVYNKTADDLVSELIAFAVNQKRKHIDLAFLDLFEKMSMHDDDLKSSVVKPRGVLSELNISHDLVDGIDMDVSAADHSTYSVQMETDGPPLEQKYLDFTPVRYAHSNSNYQNRNNSGKIWKTYSGKLFNVKNDGDGNNNGELKIDVEFNNNDDDKESSLRRFGKERDNEQIDEICDRIEILRNAIRQNNEQIINFEKCDFISSEPFYICGQVLDESDEKQESGGWFIRSDDEEDMSMVNIDLSHLHQFSLFSGKIVAMKGTNKDGSLFVPSEIFEPAKMQLPSIVNKSVVDQLSIWCACGPFTSNDTLSYEQLYDLLSLVKQQKPNILILMGPFVDRSSKAVLSPQLNMKFYDLFENLLLKISAMIEDTSTKLVLIPSFKKDATVLPIFPCASFDVRPECKKILSKNITFARDPSQLRINGVNVAITNSEIIQTLSRFEVYKSETQDEHRMQRIISHLFSQRSLYPLYPAPSDTAQRIDETIRECSLSCIPHIMIMPSMLSPMIQVIDGCLCINPGILVRGSSGTFMEMNIDMKMIQSAETDQHNCSIADYCEIKILRI